MRPALLTPMRLLSAIAGFTILCMLAVSLVTDHLADIFLSHNDFGQSSRVHLINDVNQALKRAQDARRNYLTTGDRAYLIAFGIASADVDASMDRLVTEDNEVSSKLTHAKDLRSMVHSKLTEIGTALETAPVVTRQTPPPADKDLAPFEDLLGSLGQEETQDVSGQLEAAEAATVFHRNLMATVAVINVLFLAGVGLCAMQIGKLHTLITMCAWSKRVQYQDQWIPLEEYMRKRFGVRISHGISEEEYKKWAVAEMAAVEEENANEAAVIPKVRVTPKAA